MFSSRFAREPKKGVVVGSPAIFTEGGRWVCPRNDCFIMLHAYAISFAYYVFFLSLCGSCVPAVFRYDCVSALLSQSPRKGRVFNL